jgi:SAM-dependent methyltransferase
MSSGPMNPANHDDAAKLDFAEGVRIFNYRHVVKPLLEDYPRRVTEREAAGQSAPATKEEAGSLYTADPHYLFGCALQRSMQRLAWSTASAGAHRDEARLGAELASSRDQSTASSLQLEPDAIHPDWYTHANRGRFDDIHLVPGGYWGDELVGPFYERGGAAYRLAWRGGYDAGPGALQTFARAAPQGTYERVIDFGCSFGGLTRVLRSVFPGADVVGIDISVPALTYAHYLAERDGQSIHYLQRDAQCTGFGDASFDLVTGFLLLHEVPDDVRAAIVDEAFRILRPGGTLMFLDIPPYRALRPEQAWFESFDGRGNGETFWEEFLASDFPALVRAAGFTEVGEGPLDYDEPGYWGSSALWRTGEFDQVHRWVTRAKKPVPVGAGAR